MILPYSKIVDKLNSIVVVIETCIAKILISKDQILLQEITLLMITHESLCVMLEQGGVTKEVQDLIDNLAHLTNLLNKKLLPNSEQTHQISNPNKLMN